MIFFYLKIDYNVQRNNLQLTKSKQNNIIKMSKTETVSITLQPIQQRF